MVNLTLDQPWHPEDYQDEEMDPNEHDSLCSKHEERKLFYLGIKVPPTNIKQAEKYLLYQSRDAVVKMLKTTTQLGKISHRILIRPDLKTRNPVLSCVRLMEPWATDTWFSAVTSS